MREHALVVSPQCGMPYLLEKPWPTYFIYNIYLGFNFGNRELSA